MVMLSACNSRVMFVFCFCYQFSPTLTLCELCILFWLFNSRNNKYYCLYQRFSHSTRLAGELSICYTIIPVSENKTSTVMSEPLDNIGNPVKYIKNYDFTNKNGLSNELSIKYTKSNQLNEIVEESEYIALVRQMMQIYISYHQKIVYWMNLTMMFFQPSFHLYVRQNLYQKKMFRNLRLMRGITFCSRMLLEYRRKYKFLLKVMLYFSAQKIQGM